MSSSFAFALHLRFVDGWAPATSTAHLPFRRVCEATQSPCRKNLGYRTAGRPQVILRTADELYVPHPAAFVDVIGQSAAVTRLSALVQAARAQGTQLPSLLITAERPGGRSALAHVFAAEAGYGIASVDEPVKEDALRAVLWKVIPEHRVPPSSAPQRSGGIVLVEELGGDGRRVTQRVVDLLLGLLLHGRLKTKYGLQNYGRVTVVATALTSARLPTNLLAGFAHSMRLASYTEEEQIALVRRVAHDVLPRKMPRPDDETVRLLVAQTRGNLAELRRILDGVVTLDAVRQRRRSRRYDLLAVLDLLDIEPVFAPTSAVTMPAKRLLTSADDAERYARDYLVHLGYTDARVTGAGPDGGVDVQSSRAVAQVKMEAVKSGAPYVQALFGIAALRGVTGIFFSLAGYTTKAVEFADQAGLLLFQFMFDGSVAPASAAARRVVLAAS